MLNALNKLNDPEHLNIEHLNRRPDEPAPRPVGFRLARFYNSEKPTISQENAVMSRRSLMIQSFVFVFAVSLLLSLPAARVLAQKIGSADSSGAGRLSYPETKRGDVVDNYFGTKVPDPYRWLENNDSPEVAKWVEDENKVTFAYLDKIP